MENASKALIMAAGVLIGLMVLTFFVYLFSTFGASTAQMEDKINQDQLNQFNSQFTSYEGKELTIYDVITVANLATNNNIAYSYTKRDTSSDKDSYVSVILNKNHIENDTQDSYNEKIKQDGANGDLPKYSCTTAISTITGRVYEIKFTKIN